MRIYIYSRCPILSDPVVKKARNHLSVYVPVASRMCTPNIRLLTHKKKNTNKTNATRIGNWAGGVYGLPNVQSRIVIYSYIAYYISVCSYIQMRYYCIKETTCICMRTISLFFSIDDLIVRHGLRKLARLKSWIRCGKVRIGQDCKKWFRTLLL